MLLPMRKGALPWPEISTAMIATAPTAAAPIPVSKEACDPVPRGAGVRWTSFR
jgi:hypothetical protein